MKHVYSYTCLINIFFKIFEYIFRFFFCCIITSVFNDDLFWLVHPKASKVLEYDVVLFFVSVERVFVAVTFNRLHLLHRIEALTFNST